MKAQKLKPHIGVQAAMFPEMKREAWDTAYHCKRVPEDEMLAAQARVGTQARLTTQGHTFAALERRSEPAFALTWGPVAELSASDTSSMMPDCCKQPCGPCSTAQSCGNVTDCWYIPFR